MASFFGIQTWFCKHATELSEGQKQLLNLVSIMVMQSSVLILDEPTSQLDSIAASDFLATLGKINRELGITILPTEHRLEDAFSPEGPMTRAMMMTVLARFDGVDGGGTWYEKGMEWSQAAGVSDGSAPNQQITREQLATMLYRYVGNPTATGTLAGFPDADQVSNYAEAAMRWAVETGLVIGSNGWLNPQSSATRAEVAAILSRFCTNLTL